MSFKMKLSFVVLLVGITVVNTSPSRLPSNQLEDLFFMNEQEEKSLEENALKNVVIEKVKARILNSLHLKEAPKHHQPPPKVQALVANSWTGSAKENPHTGKSEFLQSKFVSSTCFAGRGAHCLQFRINLKASSERDRNNTAEIWLYKKEGIRQFDLNLLRTGLRRHRYQIRNQSKSEGWIRLDASVLLNRVPSNILDFEVSSEMSVPLETGKDKNPLLVIHEKRREKRSSSTCQQGSMFCCMKNLYVSFRDIGWDSWILEPEGYSANICKGSCENRMDLAAKHHSTIMLLMMGKKKEVRENIHCTPEKYKPLSIIYTDESGVKVISNLPNMSVSECSCS